MAETTIWERLSQHRPGDFSIGRLELRLALARAAAAALAIQERLTGSEWADRHGYLPVGTGAETGPIRLYGYQRGLLDAMCDPALPLITVPKSTRVGYTRCLLLAIGYYIEHDPTTIAAAQPTIPDAEDFGRSEIQPMLRDTRALAKLIRAVRKGEAQDTLTDMFFATGAVLRLRGAASDDAFRRYPARVQLADEIDAEGWSSAGAKSQGDKLRLFWARGETYWNRKQIRGGTPLIEETSRIWREWLRSDQRRHFVPCPHCGEMQFLEWGGPEFAHGLKWELDELGGVKAVWYVCRANGCLIDEGHKIEMDAAGDWRATARPRTPGHAGFHIWAGMSLNPNAAWPVIVQEWMEAQSDPATLIQPFVNLRLGRPFKLTYGQELKVERFIGRREAYATEIPAPALFLTAGCDVQSGEGKDPRIEVSIYGWGRGAECWLIGHFVVRGDPSEGAVWRELDTLLKRRFRTVDGRQMPIAATCIDSGGHHTSETYDFCTVRALRRVWAIKGASEQKGRRRPVWPRKPSLSKRGTVYIVGGNAARDFVYRSLAVEKPGPRFVHFPGSTPDGAADLDDDWFRQLTRERLVIRKGGFTEWAKPKDSHEAGVCLVYAYAAVCGLQSIDRRYLRALEAGHTPPEPPPAPAESQPVPGAANPVRPAPMSPPPRTARRRRVIRSAFVGGR